MHKTALRSPAFTLVELLVVLALIGILVSLGLPAMKRSMLASKRAVCLNNLHQVGIQVSTFALQNPRNEDRKFTLGGSDWREELLLYLLQATGTAAIDTNRQTVAIFRCPAAGLGETSTRNYSYSGHPALFGSGSRRFSEVLRPAEVVLAADGTQTSSSAAAATLSVDFTGAYPGTSSREPSNAAFRHDSASGMAAGAAFVDAHAEMVTKGKFQVKNFSLDF